MHNEIYMILIAYRVFINTIIGIGDNGININN